MFFSKKLSLSFLFVNLLFHTLFFKTSSDFEGMFGSHQGSKATGQASEIKTLGFDFVGILLCRGREAAHFKIAF